MSIERRLTQAEKAAAVTASDESHAGEFITFDLESGKVLKRSPLPAGVFFTMPDNRRDSSISLATWDGTYVRQDRAS